MAAALVPPYNLERQIEQSIVVLQNFTVHREADEQIALGVLRNAIGLVFMTQVKAGFLWSGSVAAGVLIVRLPEGGWSAPASLGSVGAGFGLQIGAQSADIVIALFDQRAIDAFKGLGHLKLGGDFSVAVGPIGRSASVDGRVGPSGLTGMFSYSRSQGLFAGLSLDGAVIVRRDADNSEMYGPDVTVDEILSGSVEPSAAGKRLHGLIGAVLALESHEAMPAAATGPVLNEAAAESTAAARNAAAKPAPNAATEPAPNAAAEAGSA